MNIPDYISPVIGYQNAAHIAEKAIADGTTLREAALASGKVDAALFARHGFVKPPTESVGPLLEFRHGVA